MAEEKKQKVDITHLKEGDKVGAYQIVERIGKGRATAVYAAKLQGALDDDPMVALKIPLAAKVMELGGENIRGEEDPNVYHAPEGYLMGVEIVRALRALHKDRMLHGDVKSNNFCFYPSRSKPLWHNSLQIMDFGATKPFEWPQIGFVGSTMYCSLAAMDQLHDYEPIDDLWSAVFTIIQITTGALPWKDKCNEVRDKPNERRKIAKKGKEELHSWCNPEEEEIKLDLPTAFKKLGEKLLTQPVTDALYQELIEILQEAAEESGGLEMNEQKIYFPALTEAKINFDGEFTNEHEEFIRGEIYKKYKHPAKYTNTTLQQQFDQKYKHQLFDVVMAEEKSEASDIEMEDEEKQYREVGKEYVEWCNYVKGGKYGKLKHLSLEYFENKQQSFMEDEFEVINVKDFIIKYVPRAKHIRRFIKQHVSQQAWKKSPSFKTESILATLQSLGVAVYTAPDYFPPFYAEFLCNLANHMAIKFDIGGKVEDAFVYKRGSNILMMNLSPLLFDNRVQFIVSLLYSHPVYKELKQIYAHTSIKLKDFGLAYLPPNSPPNYSHCDYEKVPVKSIKGSCDTSQTIAMYLAMTKQTRSSDGSPDFHVSSHLPLSVAATLLKQEKEENQSYWRKIQITRDFMEGVVWYGTTWHAIHGNYNKQETARVDLWYVIEVEGMMSDDYDSIDTTIFKSNQSQEAHYKADFDWMETQQEYEDWIDKQKKISMTDIQKDIDQTNFIKWQFN